MTHTPAMKNGLSIKNLHVTRQDKEILKGISLELKPGQLHVLLGANGSGKSTLAALLAGDTRYAATQGSVSIGKTDLLKLAPEDRAKQGLFIGFQHPVEIPGLSTAQFLQASINVQRQAHGQKSMSATEFLSQAKQTLTSVGLPTTVLERPINVGFSGGEKKRLELAQLLLLKPTIAVLDEIDSGLDLDGLKLVAQSIQYWMNSDRALLLITHNPRLLKFLQVDYVHVMSDGTITQSGDAKLADKIQESGFSQQEPSHKKSSEK